MIIKSLIFEMIMMVSQCGNHISLMIMMMMMMIVKKFIIPSK